MIFNHWWYNNKRVKYIILIFNRVQTDRNRDVHILMQTCINGKHMQKIIFDCRDLSAMMFIFYMIMIIKCYSLKSTIY